VNRHAGRRGRRVGGKVRRRTWVAAAVLHGRYNAGAADHVLLEGRRRKIQLVKVVEVDREALSPEDREVEGMLAGTPGGAYDQQRILLEVGAGQSREQRTLWPGDTLLGFLDPRFP
jgi:hypothetical protein